MMIKSLFIFLCIIYYSSSCCVKICNQNGIYFKICGDDLDLNINNIHCDNIYKNIFWESENVSKQNATILQNATISQNATNKTVYSELFLNNTTLNPSPSPEKIIGVNFVEELDLTPSSFTTPSSIVSVSEDMIPKYSIEKSDNDELLYILFLIIPVSFMIIVCICYFYKSKKNRMVIPNNDIEMGDNMSDKTEETQISNDKRENPYVEIKKVIEFLITETEKKYME